MLASLQELGPGDKVRIVALAIKHLERAHQLEREALYGKRRDFDARLARAAEERSTARALCAVAHGENWK